MRLIYHLKRISLITQLKPLNNIFLKFHLLQVIVLPLIEVNQNKCFQNGLYQTKPKQPNNKII